MQTHWRLALMFDAPGGDVGALEEGLKRAGDWIRAAAGANPVRMGVADQHPDLGTPSNGEAYDVAGWRGVDGAIEITFPNAQLEAMPDICRALRPIVSGLTSLSTVEVMAGPMFSMVPVRQGGTFLSLAFRRFPRTTSAQFRDWWFSRHSGVAIPVLGAGLLAYDQVHVEPPASETASAAFGVPAVEYDAYDNLTWADRYAFLHSCSDAKGMATIAQDEVGRIDDSSRRHALMYEVN